MDQVIELYPGGLGQDIRDHRGCFSCYAQQAAALSGPAPAFENIQIFAVGKKRRASRFDPGAKIFRGKISHLFTAAGQFIYQPQGWIHMPVRGHP